MWRKGDGPGCLQSWCVRAQVGVEMGLGSYTLCPFLFLEPICLQNSILQTCAYQGLESTTLPECLPSLVYLLLSHHPL